MTTRKLLKCARCGKPMRRTGFAKTERGDAIFHYECDQCGSTMKKTLKRAWSRRRHDKK